MLGEFWCHYDVWKLFIKKWLVIAQLFGLYFAPLKLLVCIGVQPRLPHTEHLKLNRLIAFGKLAGTFGLGTLFL